MKTLITAATLLALTTPSHAAQWYLTVDIYTHDNRGGTHWSDPTRMYLENSHNECLERARIFRKQCMGLIADQNVGGFGVTKIIGYCRRHSQQPGPVLIAPEIYGDDRDIEQALEKERECAK